MGPSFECRESKESKLMQRLLAVLRSFPCNFCIVWVGVMHSLLISFRSLVHCFLWEPQKKHRVERSFGTPKNTNEIKKK